MSKTPRRPLALLLPALPVIAGVGLSVWAATAALPATAATAPPRTTVAAVAAGAVVAIEPQVGAQDVLAPACAACWGGG